MTNKDTTANKYLIVGQGVAGTLLAFRFLQNNQHFKIVDAEQGKKSSAIASGLINPVVVKTFGLSWMSETLIPEANQFYRYIENKTGADFFHPIEILRVFHNAGQRVVWDNRRLQGVAHNFMSESSSGVSDPVRAPYGGGYIRQAAWVNTEVFIKRTADYLEGKDLITRESFNYGQFAPSENGWMYKGEFFYKVIFCQGTDNHDNPWLSWLPVNPLKGQLLKITSPSLRLDNAISKNIFILPLGNNHFKIGATFERTTDTGNTPEAVEWLTTMFSQITDNSDHEVEKGYYGFRPVVPDRKPILGEHPVHKNIFVFNGLGSKGYMMGPWLSAHLYDHIFYGRALNAEVDARRFYHLYPLL
jgi:glycine oxidase